MNWRHGLALFWSGMTVEAFARYMTERPVSLEGIYVDLGIIAALVLPTLLNLRRDP